jgi:hypothetical protein
MIGWERVAKGGTDVVPFAGKAEGIAWIFGGGLSSSSTLTVAPMIA